MFKIYLKFKKKLSKMFLVSPYKRFWILEKFHKNFLITQNFFEGIFTKICD